jgi:hypothetical protein
MTPEGIRQAIMGELATKWVSAATATLPVTPIAYPNQAFQETNNIWIRPFIKMADTLYAELGDQGVGMRPGVLMVSIFDLANTGSKKSLGYAERLESFFRRKEISGVIFEEPTTDILGIEDNGYFHTMVSVNFSAWVGEA